MFEQYAQYDWRLDLQVRYGEVGRNGLASLVAVANWLQEAAVQSANHLEFGEQAMSAHNLLWVLTRLILRIHTLPGPGDLVRVTTWPSVPGRFYRRGYLLHSASGQLLLEGGSAWSVINAKERKMSSLPPALLERYPTDLKPCLDFLPGALPRLPVDAQTVSAKILARQEDQDTNLHVNNAHYLAWLLECLPFEHQGGTQGQTNLPCLLDVGFRHECFAGDELESLCCDLTQPSEPDLGLNLGLGACSRKGHAIRRNGDDVCRAVSFWVN